MTVLIAGGGIGGLATALALDHIGVPCQIFEAAPDIRALGVGINIQPHAVKELDALGLLPALDKAGLRTAEVGYFSRHGHTIWSEPRGIAAGYRWPQFSIHRGHLQMLLLNAVRDRMGGSVLTTGCALEGWKTESKGITARFSDGSRATGTILIAADGIHSTARSTMFPDEGPPLWNGTLMWRGTTWAPSFLTGRSMAMIGAKSRKFVCYPIGTRRDEVLVNWIADLSFPTDHDWQRESWNRPGRAGALLPSFGDWRFDWLDVASLINHAEAIWEWPMVDRDPLPHWTDGRMTLLGDAAHPMYPIGSNGASQAILDAVTLAREIAGHGETPAALERYEATRRPATSAIVLANRGDGPDKVLDIVEDRAPDGFDLLDTVISRQELEDIASRYKLTAGMDIARLNDSPAILPE